MKNATKYALMVVCVMMLAILPARAQEIVYDWDHGATNAAMELDTAGAGLHIDSYYVGWTNQAAISAELVENTAPSNGAISGYTSFFGYGVSGGSNMGVGVNGFTVTGLAGDFTAVGASSNPVASVVRDYTGTDASTGSVLLLGKYTSNPNDSGAYLTCTDDDYYHTPLFSVDGKGHLQANTDVVGTLTCPAGQTSYTRTFSKAYATAPNAILSWKNVDVNRTLQYSVSTTGITIYVTPASYVPMSASYIIVGN